MEQKGESFILLEEDLLSYSWSKKTVSVCWVLPEVSGSTLNTRDQHSIRDVGYFLLREKKKICKGFTQQMHFLHVTIPAWKDLKPDLLPKLQMEG